MIRYYEDLIKPHEYWDQRPTLRDDREQTPGNVEGKREVKDVPKDGVPLPKPELKWCDINVQDDLQLDEVSPAPPSSTTSSPTTTWRTTTTPTASTTPASSCAGHSLPPATDRSGWSGSATRTTDWWPPSRGCL